MYPWDPRLHRTREERTIRRGIAAALALAAAPGMFWFVGTVRHNTDLQWCRSGDPNGPGMIVNKTCMAEREARRWGPFLAFGTNVRRNAGPDGD